MYISSVINVLSLTIVLIHLKVLDTLLFNSNYSFTESSDLGKCLYTCICFILRTTGLSNKIFEQGFVKDSLKTSLNEVCSRYGNLPKQYEAPLSWKLNDMLKFGLHGWLIRWYLIRMTEVNVVHKMINLSGM